MIQLRPNEELPLAQNCPRHLRVICGTCEHFDGKLRDHKARTCLSTREEAHSGDVGCVRWSRKSVKP
ncbi:hypothetical protein [Chachezhania antarctica]|uniref:hypothetical protein n=1 Tax=Chachezhania antarctica TaxID=2340860 RepID=UPI0013CEF0E1|nr:hypothetical protein [Chachezhania antarctica]